MKIAMILPSLANKGPIIVAHDLCNGLISLGHSCKVYYFDNIVELEMPCPTERINFWKRINYQEYDIIHSHMYRPDAYVFYHKPWLKKSKTKWVTTLHQHLQEQIPYNNFGKIKAFICIQSWLLFLHRFDKIVVLSEYHEKYYKEENHLKKVSVIYNARDINTLLDVDSLDKERILCFKKKYKLIGAVAFITVRKGYEQLLNVLLRLPDYGILFVGEGPDVERLKLLASALKVNDRCIWIGKRSGGYRYLRYVDVFVMCSRTEGFPLTLVEAAAMGVPVVCSNIPVLSSIISQKVAVFFDLDRVETLEKAIKRIEKNKLFFSNAVFEYYKMNLTLDVMVSKYIEFYQSFH